MSQGYGTQEVNDPRDVGNAKGTHQPYMGISVDAKAVNAMEHSQDSYSIEKISGPEELEDEVFLGYFAVDNEGKKRPIPAPRRLVQMPAVRMTGLTPQTQ